VQHTTPMVERTYDEKHATLVQYLLVKVQERDWHGVSDAANDLRVLEAGYATIADDR
jgi:hypothetical protein